MSAPLQFLVGTNSDSISLVAFDPSAKSLKTVKTTKGFTTPSWIEPSANKALKGKVYYAVSEETKKVLSLELQSDGSVKETGSAPTNGNCAHVHALKDGSGLVVTNYVGGSALFVPVDSSSGQISGSPSPLLEFKSPYGKGPGPHTERQDASHPHHCVEGQNGDLYIPDLGSDRVWQIKKKGQALELSGQCDAKGGSGPRHAALHSNGKYLYLITELAHEVLIFPLPSGGVAATSTKPDGPRITPQEIPQELHGKMTSGEIVLNPTNDRVLYVSNRGQVLLNSETKGNAQGDAIAVMTLNQAGDQIEHVEIIPTQVNFIRGMSITPDGKYLGLVGQEDGKAAVYQTGGQYGEKLELVAIDNVGLDTPTDVTWI